MKVYVYKEPYLKGESIESADAGAASIKALDPIQEEMERQHKKYQNMRRTKNIVNDYALSNDFDYFITLTFGEERDNDKRCFDRLTNWLKYMRKKYGKFRYIIIPERHKTGEIHFHGLIGDFKGNMIESPVTYKKKLKKKKGEKQKFEEITVYNIEDWRYGFTTATKVSDKYKVANYITKYITKNMHETVEFNKKKYWSSHGLQKPVESYYETELFDDLKPDFENEIVKIINI